MHFFAYEDRSLGYPRKIEKLFRIVGKALWALQLALVMIGIVLIVIAAEDMFTESPLAAGASLSFNPTYSTIFTNCSSTTNVDTYLLTNVPFVIDSGNVEFLFGLYTEKVIAAIVVAAFSVAVSLANKILYDLNIFFHRFKFLMIRKDILSTMDMILLCGSIGANAIAHDFASPLRNHVKVCTTKYNSESSSGSVAVSTGGSRSYLAPENFVPIYLAACLALLLHVVTFGLLIKHTLIDSEVPPPPEKGDDTSSDEDEPDSNEEDDKKQKKSPSKKKNKNKKEEPVADPTKEKPPQSTLDRQKEQRILQNQRKRAQEEADAAAASGGDDSSVMYAIENNNNNNNQNSNNAGMVDSPTRYNTHQQQQNANYPPPPSTHHNRNTNNKVRGTFAAMRAAAAFRAASSRATSQQNNAGGDGESPATTNSPSKQQQQQGGAAVASSRPFTTSGGNTGMYSDPGRAAPSSYEASSTPQNYR